MATNQQKEAYKERMLQRFLEEDPKAIFIVYLAQIVAEIQRGKELEAVCLCGWCADFITPEQILFAEKLTEHVERKRR